MIVKAAPFSGKKKFKLVLILKAVLISAMFTGKKDISGTPIDAEDDNYGQWSRINPSFKLLILHER